jgi:hypothetical protein
MRSLLIPGTLALLLGATTVQASDEYRASIESCQAAIAARLGMSADDLRTRLDGVDSSARYRDLEFSVSALDAANPAQGLEVNCRARRSGDVLAVTFDESTVPDAVALH